MERGASMSTRVLPEISTTKKYHINKERFYELKHFCLQYPEWKKKYLNLSGYMSSNPMNEIRSCNVADITANCAIDREFYSKRITMIQQCSEAADHELANYILKAVTEELSYEYLKGMLDIPCCRKTYYDRYRKFFYILDKVRD